MPSEVIRCSDCGATFKGVPSWLATASVKFTCTNCPKRPARSMARFEPAPEPVTKADTDTDTDLDAAEIEDLEDMDEMDLGDDLDLKDEDI